jgi:hypothetical protein
LVLPLHGGRPKKVGGCSTDNYTKWAVDYIKQRSAKPTQPWRLWLCYDGVHHPFTPAARHKGDYPVPGEDNATK